MLLHVLIFKLACLK